MSTELATTKEDKTPMRIDDSGVQISTLDDLWRFSGYIVSSGWAPKGVNREGIVIAVQMGLEIGLKPMQAIQNIAVINGRPTVWGDAMLALCMDSSYFDNAAFKEWHDGTGDKRTAYCSVRRLPNGQVQTAEFSVSAAKTAGLWSKAGPWKTYPDRMLKMRARAFALRDAFPDVLKGVYAREEIIDTEATVVESRRITSSDLNTALDEPAESAPVEPEPIDAEVSEVAPEPEPEPVTPHSKFEELCTLIDNVKNETQRHTMVDMVSQAAEKGTIDFMQQESLMERLQGVSVK